MHLHSAVKCNEVFQLNIHAYIHTYIHTLIHLNLNSHITHQPLHKVLKTAIFLYTYMYVCTSLRIQQFLSCFICIHSMSSCFCKHTIKPSEHNKTKNFKFTLTADLYMCRYVCFVATTLPFMPTTVNVILLLL